MEKLEHLKSDYLLANQNLQMSMQQLNEANAQANELRNANEELRIRIRNLNQDRTENFVTVDQYNDVATQFNEPTESYVRMEKEMQERISDL